MITLNHTLHQSYPVQADSDKDVIEQDSLENIEPLPEPLELVQDDGSVPSEVQEQRKQPQEEIEGQPESGQLEGGQPKEMQGEEAGLSAEEPEADAPGEVQEDVGEDVSRDPEESEIPDDEADAAAAGEFEADEAEGYQEEEETYDDDEDDDEGDLVEGYTEEPLEEPFSPAFSESKTFDIIDTSRDFGSEGNLLDLGCRRMQDGSTNCMNISISTQSLT